MVNVKIVAVGKIKESFHREEINELVKRLSRYCKLSIIEVDEYKLKDDSDKMIELTLMKEGEALLKQIKSDEYVFLLDLHGSEMSSEKLSLEMDKLISSGRNITFVIGGSYGLSSSVRERSNVRLKISPMTFTHQMCRIIILEQIYRSFKIINKESYHK
ncbi:MAG: 23S rRNA (pseudouridine(1915)-N(3))-methyltransferase RlmH [Erysipelotrichaceae bacterium]|nr:23S rRNA (pseudouridine(1915)-N(3))-methyltransferase RlmH [Erysipelotrichaceae bacterium]